MTRRMITYMTLLLLLTLTAAAQQVKLVSLTALEQRFKAGRDTTYVVNFWATWCVPCVQELPHFEAFRQAHANEPVKILLVSLDAPSRLAADVIPFVQRKKLRSEVLLLNETDQQAYIDRISPDWSGSLPATLFVNTGKNIRQLQEKEFTGTELTQTYQSLK